MKHKIQIIFIAFWTLNLFSQTMVKVEPDNEKNKYFYLRFLDENDMFLSTKMRDQNGFYNLKSLRTKEITTCRVYLDDCRFIKIDKNLDLKSNDTLIIKLKPNPNCNDKIYPKDVIVKNCRFYDYMPYIPKEFDKLSDLPLDIVNKAKKHLSANINKKFLKKIYFKRAQLLDSIKFNKDRKINKLERRFHYYICFAFSNLSKGIGEYTFNIECDEFGNIINEMQIPKNKLDVNKLVALKEILDSIEIKNIYSKERTNIDFDFDNEYNIFVWKFTNNEYLPKNELVVKEYLFNAHNGKFIEIKVHGGTWD